MSLVAPSYSFDSQEAFFPEILSNSALQFKSIASLLSLFFTAAFQTCDSCRHAWPWSPFLQTQHTALSLYS